MPAPTGHATYQSLGDLLDDRASSPPPPAAAPAAPPTATRATKHEQLTDSKDRTTWQLNQLTVGILGAQLAWTVEMAYGTPYLLSLGLTKQATSLVWMAGPSSGLIVQPVVGALSDAATASHFRRRFYILLSAALIVASTLVVAYARELAATLCSFTGLGDWDPENGNAQKHVAIAFGVVGFYVLDFSLNGLQASLRALVLDLSPGHLQSLSNAWLGRHTHLGNIIGYLFGYLDLGHSSFLSWLGGGQEGSQFRKLAVISLAVMLTTVGITCATQHERPRGGPEDDGNQASASVSVWKRVWRVGADVKDNFRDLPIPVRRVCYVQFCAWTAWFPFLFYSTTYVAEELYASLPKGAPIPSSDDATRSGSFALLLYSLVSLVAGTVIPFLTHLATTYPSLPSRVGPAGRWLLARMTPRNAWTVGLAWYAACMVLTFFLSGLKGATAVVAISGVPWAITCWVPFALVMESINELEEDAERESTTSNAAPMPTARDYGSLSLSQSQSRKLPPFRVTSLRNSSYQPFSGAASPSPSPASPGRDWPTSPTARRRLPDESEPLLSSPRSEREPKRVGGGTILGLHNMAVVMPQFFVAIVAAGIFKLTSSRSASALRILASNPPPEAGDGLQGQNDVVWVLRFGGLAAFVGIFVSRYLCETKSEREYREYVEYGWRDSIPPRDDNDDGSDC